MTIARVLAVFVVLCPALFAQLAEAPPDAEARIQKIFEAFQRKASPGCTVGVSLNGATVLTAAYGMADLEHNVALRPDSVMEAGSVSKQFTAAAVLLLAQDGALSLDDPVRKYIPELPDYGKPLTIRHLLHHTSGLRDWGGISEIEGWPRGTRTATNIHALEIASRQKSLNHAPGAAYSYTNTGYNLLAILVGRVSKKTLAEFTRERIFGPLGMKSTEWRDDYQRIVPNRAIAYAQTKDAIRQQMPFENAYGNGGLLTTVRDLLLWSRNFTGKKVGGAALIEEQLRQAVLNDGTRIHYAAGIGVNTRRGLREESHSGVTAGYRAWLGRYPERGVAVAVLCNTSAAESTALGHAVADVFLATPSTPNAAAVRVDAKTLAPIAGLYRSTRDHRTMAIGLKDGQLEMQGKVTLRPMSPKSFRAGAGSAVLEFESDSSGKVTGARESSQGELINSFEKVERAHPDRAQLAALTGDYVSEEADVTFHVVLGPNGLVMVRRPGVAIPLTPTYRDGFNSTVGSVRFLRNPAGQVTEMSIGTPRVWDLRLKRR